MPDPTPYDALLLVSFGGPEKPEDVVPFLRNVTAGKDIPDARLEEVGEHYYGFGGRSPINDQNRALLEAIRGDLAASGVDLPVFWGNRNWDPYLADTLVEMREAGVTRALALVTSAYSSYSGCRQYRENLAGAVAEVPGAPQLDKLRHYYNHPGFIEPMVDATLAALAELPEDARRSGHLAFVTHSIPTSMDAASGPEGHAYVAQHRLVAAEVVDRVREETGHRYPWELVFCSRSGPPHVPWLEPDVNDHLRGLRDAEVAGAVVVPIGFVSDHMEVIYDLDTEARATAEEIGLPFARAATAGVDPRFVAMVRDLVLERAAQERGQVVEQAVVSGPPSWNVCPAGCCANPRGPRPALCGQD
ncbi:ferrochelatase [Nocardioides scoriae]|uniref:Coproporphyrin III ferrochelatase n=1 Tax=Nocardioides scoriae TaxID=642780 RepID=A0A1H1Q5U8_9ACTN|nr:ferrochelatase [Nocardioides scoriae]SDS18881.1 ferrochelatase [Nocardioides scoriae]